MTAPAHPPSDARGLARSLFVRAPDGLRLHVRDYGSRLWSRLPVVCLPGLARTTADFETLAVALATDAKTPRRVIAMDYRGRGLSDYDRDPENYSLPVELADLIAVLTACAVHRAVFVGTSRGGILAMLLGAAQPTRIAGVVLNDIGPVIELMGLMRIKSYLGKLPQPRDLADGAAILKRVFEGQFPKFSEDNWLAFAARTWTDRGGALTLDFDVRLARLFDGMDAERPLPSLWPQFDSLARAPMLLLRGALSDILSPETVAAMRARRRKLEFVEVPDQGHAPILDGPDLIQRIAAFARACDTAAGVD
ncbi:MAG: alpha/beta hydrolase [Variibacter sp.]|nr:alpha/beta hydrolase [Variibacter sp.]